jgi:putative Mg2+ transporter-C (MgtC) family protein
MDWSAFWDLHLLSEATFKITLAGVLGGIIGFERESHGQSAGFRTYILVAVSGCLIMMTSLHLEELFRHVGAESAVRVDPGRIASYALAGMGFLGAGAIIIGKGSVRGLTTAAGMWMITAVGLAVGSGYYIPAIVVTLMCIFSLYVLRHVKGGFKRDIYTTLQLVCDDVGGQLDRIQTVITKYPFSHIQFVALDRDLIQGIITFQISLMSKEDLEWRDLMRELTDLPGVRQIGREEGKVP